MPDDGVATKAEESTPAHTGGPIVVGFDGSEGGRDALELARVLSSIRGDRCIVATALTYGPVSVRTAISDKSDPETEALFAEARKALAGHEIETHVVGTRSPGRMLIEAAEREGASTLVVGSPHRGKVGRAVLGSVADHILHRAPCEVVVAPRGYGETRHLKIAKVAVAYDGTGAADQALRRGEDLARQAGAEIEVLVAEEPVVMGIEGDELPMSPRSADEVLAFALSSIDSALPTQGRKLVPDWHRLVRSIADVIADACGSDTDLVVAGGRKAADRFFLGSVTKHLVDVAPCPVLIVPRAG